MKNLFLSVDEGLMALMESIVYLEQENFSFVILQNISFSIVTKSCAFKGDFLYMLVSVTLIPSIPVLIYGEGMHGLVILQAFDLKHLTTPISYFSSNSIRKLFFGLGLETTPSGLALSINLH